MDRQKLWVVIGGFITVLLYLNKSEIEVMAKRITNSGLNLIAGFEGFSAMPYPDAQGQSVGFGHFILPSDNFNFPITRETGHKLLLDDTRKADAAIDKYVTVPLSNNQRDALVSLIYNIGVGAFSGSTLLRKLNAGDYVGAAEQFSVWRKSQGKVLPVLVARREKEKELFQTV